MTSSEQLRSFYEKLCAMFPKKYVVLELTVSRHPTFATRPGTQEAHYSCYIEGLVHLEAPTVPDLIERTTIEIKKKLQQSEGDAADLLEQMASW